MAPKIPPTAVPAIAPPNAIASTPLATTGPTPGMSIAAAAPSSAPTPAPVAMPASAPGRSLAPISSVIIPPLATSDPRMANPTSSALKPACSKSSTARSASSRSAKAATRVVRWLFAIFTSLAGRAPRQNAVGAGERGIFANDSAVRLRVRCGWERVQRECRQRAGQREGGREGGRFWLDVDRLLVDRQGGFLQSLFQGRVRMKAAADVFDAGGELHGDGGFGDQLGGVGGEDVHPEKAIALGVADDFDEAVGFVGGAGVAVGGEGEFPDLDLMSAVARVVFAVSDLGELRA